MEDKEQDVKFKDTQLEEDGAAEEADEAAGSRSNPGSPLVETFLETQDTSSSSFLEHTSSESLPSIPELGELGFVPPARGAE
eukprot:15812734-Heterocapsa_arctica.AAC.1